MNRRDQLIENVTEVKWRLLIIWLSIKWMFRINLGDLIHCHGRKMIVCNGVMVGRLDVEDLMTGQRLSVACGECRKVWTLNNMLSGFRFGYRFYMRNWFDIWKRDGIKPWMKGCNIW